MINPNKNPQQPTQADQQKQQDRNRQRGTGFTNINKVLGANVGAGKEMGQKIGSSLSGQAGAIKEGIKQGQAGFQAGMQSGAQQAQSAIQQGQALKQQEGEQADAYANRLAGIGQDQPVDLAAQGKALRSAAYQGPQGMEKAGQLTSQAATASALAKLGGTAGGQQQLLASQVAGRGGYGTGHSALDRMLLAKGGQQEIQRGRGALTGIESAAQGAVQGAQQQAVAQVAGIEANKTKALQDLQSQLSGEGKEGPKGFLTQAKEQAADFNTKASKIQQMLSGKNPDGTTIDATHPSQYSQEDIALLNDMESYGIDPNQMIYGKNISEYGSALGDISSNVDLSQQSRYMGNQAQAAKNLATFLSDQGASTINVNPFNEQVFNKGQQQSAMSRNEQAQQLDLAQQKKLQDLSKEASVYGAVRRAFKPNVSDTNIKLDDGRSLAQARDSLVAQLTPEEQRIARSFGTLGQSLEYAQDALSKRAASSVGQKKSMQQLALERLGQKYTAPQVKDVTEKKLTQK